MAPSCWCGLHFRAGADVNRSFWASLPRTKDETNSSCSEIYLNMAKGTALLFLSYSHQFWMPGMVMFLVIMWGKVMTDTPWDLVWQISSGYFSFCASSFNSMKVFHKIYRSGNEHSTKTRKTSRNTFSSFVCRFAFSSCLLRNFVCQTCRKHCQQGHMWIPLVCSEP